MVSAILLVGLFENPAQISLKEKRPCFLKLSYMIRGEQNYGDIVDPYPTSKKTKAAHYPLFKP